MAGFRGPVAAVIVAPILTFVTYSSAVKSAAGEALEISGRRQGIKQLIVSAGEYLGPSGSLAVGGGATVLAIFWLVWTARAHQKMTAAANEVDSD